MKRAKGIVGALILALLFAGCAAESGDKQNDLSGQQESTEEKSAETSPGQQESAEEKSAETLSGQQESAEEKSAEALTLSEEDFNRLQAVAEEYYTSMNRKMLGFTQADPASPFYGQEYEGYGPDEVALFEVTVENSEAKRYIAIGSKDGWIHCSVLNEGY